LHPETRIALTRWHFLVRKAEWRKFEDVRATFSTADRAGAVLIFDVMGDNYRLIATVSKGYKRLYVKALLTHKTGGSG